MCSVVESGPGVVKPREILTLTCAVSGFSVSSSGYIWDWIRQPPRKGLEWMGYVYPQAGTTGSARLSRAESPSLTFSLQLRSLTAADTATYYCARNTHSDTEQSRDWHKRGKRFLNSSGRPQQNVPNFSGHVFPSFPIPIGAGRGSVPFLPSVGCRLCPVSSPHSPCSDKAQKMPSSLLCPYSCFSAPGSSDQPFSPSSCCSFPIR
uniref:Ig-like domain-containing protein n=1 Tax=Chrysemys picta bellii TaxID=8478 RepID=A0A8C3FHZ5_CHRPI